MRIGLLIYGNLDTVSGGYLYNRQLVAYLLSRGEQVVVFSLPLRSYWRHLGDNFRSAYVKQILAAKLDILIQDEMAHPSLVWLNRRLAGLPLVALVHLFTVFDKHSRHKARFYRAIEQRYLKSVNGLIANSQTTLQQAGELLKDKLPAYCVAVPAGNHLPALDIDFAALQRRTLSPGPLQILVVGNVIRRKGLHVLLKALSLLPAGDFQVAVAGRLDMEPVYVRQVCDLIRAKGLAEQVKLLGAVQGAEIVDLYRRHQLMVLPSAFESYGIVYLEAQQFGLPVIGTTAGAAWEIITDGDNGYLIEPEDAQGLAAVLRKLQQEREVLLELSRKALAAFARHQGWEESCELIRQFLYARL